MLIVRRQSETNKQKQVWLLLFFFSLDTPVLCLIWAQFTVMCLVCHSRRRHEWLKRILGFNKLFAVVQPATTEMKEPDRSAVCVDRRRLWPHNGKKNSTGGNRTFFGGGELVCLTYNSGAAAKSQTCSKGRDKMSNVAGSDYLSRSERCSRESFRANLIMATCADEFWLKRSSSLLLANSIIFSFAPPHHPHQFVNHLCIIIPVSKWLSCWSQAPLALVLSWADSRPVLQGTCHPDMMKVPSRGLRRDMSWPSIYLQQACEVKQRTGMLWWETKKLKY